ncbi:MAG: histidine phosphatase family protein [Bacillota bacterium]|nr:histidine phosphatase family protein [Bacillota bacterium]
MTLYLVRHGTTSWNEEGRFQGWSDVPLNGTGRQQSHWLGQRLQSVPLDAVYASDLQRAVETAAIIRDYLAGPPPLITDERLRESRFGQWEGLTSQEIARRFPLEWEKHRQGWHVPGGESLAEVEARLRRFSEDLFAQPWKAVLVVAHGALIRSWLTIILGMDLSFRRHFAVENGSLSKVKAKGLADPHARVIRWNETAAGK